MPEAADPVVTSTAATLIIVTLWRIERIAAALLTETKLLRAQLHPRAPNPQPPELPS